jgi:hypothetical protein
MFTSMTELLERAIEWAKTLPDKEQDLIAKTMFNLIDEDVNLDELPEEDRAAVLEGLAQLDRSEVATQEEVDAVFSRYCK